MLSKIIISALFFLSGFAMVLNTQLVSYARVHLHLTETGASAVSVVFYAAFIINFIISLYLVKGRGLTQIIRLGALVAAIGSLIISLSGAVANYWVLLTGDLFLGIGIALLQASGMPFILSLAERGKGTALMTLIESFTAVGMVSAPFLGVPLLIHRSDTLANCYLILAGSWLAAFFASYRFPTTSPIAAIPLGKFLRFSLANRMAQIALTVGIEVCWGVFLITLLHCRAATDVYLIHYYWLGFVTGRFAGSYLMRWFAPIQMARWHVAIGMLFGILMTLDLVSVTAALVFVLGWSISILYPVIFSAAIRENAQAPLQASALLMACNSGGAVLSFTQAVCIDWVGLRPSFMIPVVGYALLLLLLSASKRPIERST